MRAHHVTPNPWALVSSNSSVITCVQIPRVMSPHKPCTVGVSLLLLLAVLVAGFLGPAILDLKSSCYFSPNKTQLVVLRWSGWHVARGGGAQILDTGCCRLVWGSDPGHWMLQAGVQRSVPRGARRRWGSDPGHWMPQAGVGIGSWTLDAAGWRVAFSASWSQEEGGARILDTGGCRLVWGSDPGHWMRQAGV
ncbi:hypothetical protein NDU88_010977 [Pleurodeles waltl]|uniref:Uncharacterized protein n=1 Tax=Pleurodeles waltl TaxID=8319 RepID=A0AAV7S424_PLEWA|nr:hypothetical protein NDU88_010977 [Pleurodeles waltl]